jgi:hypothetical protein
MERKLSYHNIHYLYASIKLCRDNYRRKENLPWLLY